MIKSFFIIEEAGQEHQVLVVDLPFGDDACKIALKHLQQNDPSWKNVEWEELKDMVEEGGIRVSLLI